MKYKNIDAMLHNFCHSFISLMNYVDNEYIVDDLDRLARLIPGHEIRIDFSSCQINPAFDYPERVHKSIQHWRDWLPKHLENHGIQPLSIGPVIIRFRLTRQGQEVIAETTDDRGICHKQFVRK